jgi:hypothetical protein
VCLLSAVPLSRRALARLAPSINRSSLLKDVVLSSHDCGRRRANALSPGENVRRRADMAGRTIFAYHI